MSNRARRRKPLELDPPMIDKPTRWQRVLNALGLGPSTGPVCVAQVSNRVQADLMVGYLRSRGINAHLSADDAGGTDPILQYGFGVRVLVAHGQADAAQKLLADADL
jgi:hypothetical protein